MSDHDQAIGPEQESRLRRYFWGRRQGRPLKGQRAEALARLPDFQVNLDETRQGQNQPQTFFSQQVSACWLEIGFGNGEHLLEQARRNPSVGLIGCEPFINGIAFMLRAAVDDNLRNIRVWPEDARVMLKCLESASIQRCFVLFPDPWPKKNHHKRRIINRETATELARVVACGGIVRLATDHPELAEWMRAEMAHIPEFVLEPHSINNPHAVPQDWVTTRYQQKAKAGPVTWWLDYRRARRP
jgi:tRNA (guanine-N7-)-methyltransferase